MWDTPIILKLKSLKTTFFVKTCHIRKGWKWTFFNTTFKPQPLYNRGRHVASLYRCIIIQQFTLSMNVRYLLFTAVVPKFFGQSHHLGSIVFFNRPLLLLKFWHFFGQWNNCNNLLLINYTNGLLINYIITITATLWNQL